LIIDDFEQLFDGDRESIKLKCADELLASLRAIKEQRNYYCIQSFIGAGVFRGYELVKVKKTCFNVVNTIYPPNFTVHETYRLFSDFKYDYNLNFPEDVMNEIHLWCNGNPRHICDVGKLLYYTVKQGTIDFNLTQWKDIYAKKSIIVVGHSNVISSMLNKLNYPTEENYLKSRQIIRKIFFEDNREVIFNDTRIDYLEILFAEGVLTKRDGYTISSPLIKQILLAYLKE